MGSRDKRERLQRILSGDEKPIHHDKLVNTAISILQRQSTDKQVGVLEEAIGEDKLKQGKLREQLEKTCTKEMRKGVARQIKQGKTPTVDSLLEEYRHERAFQQLAASVGLDEVWFIKLAETELKQGGFNAQ